MAERPEGIQQPMSSKLRAFEILVAGTWEKVKGTTNGVREGWLSWDDGQGCTGLSRPGTWREIGKSKN
jgi:hypothetical protein